MAVSRSRGLDELPLVGHWGILCNTGRDVQGLCRETTTRGDPVFASPMGSHKAVGLLLPAGPLTLVCIAAESGRVLTFYPMAGGITHRAVFRKVLPYRPAFEGDIEIAMGSTTLTVFDAMYFRNHAAYKAGANYDFMLSGIAYSLKRAGDGRTKDRDGRAFSLKGMAGFAPMEKGAPGEYSFYSPVTAVERFEANGKHLLRLTIHLFYLKGENAANGYVDIHLYVRQDRLNGYVPTVGDDVTGVMWLQGYLA